MDGGVGILLKGDLLAREGDRIVGGDVPAVAGVGEIGEPEEELERAATAGDCLQPLTVIAGGEGEKIGGDSVYIERALSLDAALIVLAALDERPARERLLDGGEEHVGEEGLLRDQDDAVATAAECGGVERR